MKQKRTFVTILLIVALLCLGIAYAAISGVDLTIGGTAKATASDVNFKVKFVEEEITPVVEVADTDPDIEATATAEVTGDITATINCSGLTTKGDYVTATYTVKNDSPELSAYITASAECTNDVFTVTTDWEDTTKTLTADGTDADTTTITVKVELNTTVAEDEEGTVTVTLTAESTEPEAV